MTFEATVLNYYPDVRDAVAASADYAAWRDDLEKVEVDGEELYIRGGDMLKDEEQIMFEWARLQGMISDEEIKEALSAGKS